MHRVLACMMFATLIPTAQAASYACDDTGLPSDVSDLCSQVPVVRAGHVVVGDESVCVGGVSHIRIEFGPGGVTIYYCPFHPFGPGFDPLREWVPRDVYTPEHKHCPGSSSYHAIIDTSYVTLWATECWPLD